MFSILFLTAGAELRGFAVQTDAAETDFPEIPTRNPMLGSTLDELVMTIDMALIMEASDATTRTGINMVFDALEKCHLKAIENDIYYPPSKRRKLDVPGT